MMSRLVNIRRFIIAATLCTLTLCSCTRQKDGPVTMLVSQGFSEHVFRTIAEDVKRDLDIDVEFVYESSENSSTLILEEFAHHNLHSDIVFTYAKVPDKYLKGSCLDFVDKSNLVSHYSYTRTKDFISDDGCAYQLPLSSRLIGITYNATLMQEHGWEPPKTYHDLLELKRKCENADVLFSVTDLKYAGHPFNYLFNIMGSQWLSTLKGEVWFKGFLEGRKTMHAFTEKARYFQRWTEDGLFGEIADANTGAYDIYSKQRALLLFANRNTSSGYSGPQYDRNGEPTGKMLNDEYKVIPWISEDGSNNCFTLCYNCWVMVNNDLTAKGSERHLHKTLEVIEYLMQDKYSQMVLSESKDLYSVFDSTESGDDRLYYDYIDDIKQGFLQPWYYNYFEDPTIIATGTEIGSYILNTYDKNSWSTRSARFLNYSHNPNANFGTAIGMLRNSLHAMRDDYLGWADEDIASPKLAELTAICSGMSLQETLYSATEDSLNTPEVTAALMPYVTDLSELQPWKPICVQNATIVEGILQTAYSYVLEPSGGTHVAGIRMTGLQIKDLLSKGFDPSCYFIDSSTGQSSFDSSKYGPYPYACVIKNGEALEDGHEYVVAVAPKSLVKDVYESFLQQGKVLTGADGDVLMASVSEGFKSYFGTHDSISISNSNIAWSGEATSGDESDIRGGQNDPYFIDIQ